MRARGAGPSPATRRRWTGFATRRATTYAAALRGILQFPLVVYRVTTAAAYEDWRAGRLTRPVSTTTNLDLARVVKEVAADPEPMVLIEGRVKRPEAVIMRGRIEAYEIVVDTALVEPVEVRVLS